MEESHKRPQKRALTILSVVLFVVLSLGLREYIITVPLGLSSTQTQAAILETHTNKTKVLFFTYMRGGSSLLGELVNQNPDATLWFEPIDGVYSDMYATVHGWFPLDILYTTDGKPRDMPRFEKNAIIDQINNLYSCNIDAMTTDTLGHFAMTRIVQKNFKEYADCLRDINEGQHGVSAPYYCKGRTVNICPRYFTTNSTALTTCYYCLHASPASAFHTDDSSSHTWSGKAFDSHCKQTTIPFNSYATCMNTYRKVMSRCLPLVQKTCDESSIVGIKTIRLRADIVVELMQQQPDLKLVYVIRDPRGVVHSRRRSGLMSRLSDKQVTTEAKALCSRISADLTSLKNIINKFAERVMQIRYEDFVLDPVKHAHNFYKFIGKDMPAGVEQSLNEHLFSEVQGGPFETTRKNGTDSIYKWRHYLNLQEIKDISNVCSSILETYNYPPS